jgi:hypothetical protein
MKLSEAELSRSHGDSRRGFLRTMGSLTAAAAVSPQRAGAAVQPQLPQIRIGKHSIPRLICGSNPFGGLSHISELIDREMHEYFTPIQVLKTLRRCEEVGINAVQGLNPELYRRFTEGGGKIQLFSNGQGDAARLQKTVQSGCIGIHHYGVVTDAFYKKGQLGTVKEYVKRVRDTGLLVGVATHIPAVVDAVESEGWDVDYLMTCVYQWGRTREELEGLFGARKDLLPVESNTSRSEYVEVFLQNEPSLMYRAIRQARKPCLAYKILAAGRKCERPGMVEQAFKEAFENIKSTDAVIVGFYDRYADQQAANAEYVRRFGSNNTPKS